MRAQQSKWNYNPSSLLTSSKCDNDIVLLKCFHVDKDFIHLTNNNNNNNTEKNHQHQLNKRRRRFTRVCKFLTLYHCKRRELSVSLWVYACLQQKLVKMQKPKSNHLNGTSVNGSSSCTTSSSSTAASSIISPANGNSFNGNKVNTTGANGNSTSILTTLNPKTFNLPESLEMIQKCEYFPTQRHRWNTNEEIASILIGFDKHGEWLSKEVKIR